MRGISPMMKVNEWDDLGGKWKNTVEKMEGISPMVEAGVVDGGVMEAPPSVAAVSHKNWLVFEHNWSRHCPSLSW